MMGVDKLAEILRASPFNKELLNETTFSLIHLAGQYLKGRKKRRQQLK
jgi:hypothetical protein